mmetsp:Transcript_7072/g.14105  ORF Transcript_7072/g.14105 Transcript_7072/m.14105 type:complete len:228 (-) Transcript_7072:225-908(-)
MTPSSLAIFGVQSRIMSKHSSLMVCGGMEHAESPEWTPACSICCMIPQITTLPSASAKASTSNSSALSRYLSTNTGLSGSTSTAVLMYRDTSFSEYTISMALPPNTNDGRTMTGKPRFFAILTASSSFVATPPGGCLISSLFKRAIHLSLSSASSIESGCVPQILTFPSPEAAGIGFSSNHLANGVANFRGVCPPNWTMMPSGRSFSITLSTSSTVNGSKYKREDVS